MAFRFDSALICVVLSFFGGVFFILRLLLKFRFFLKVTLRISVRLSLAVFSNET